MISASLAVPLWRAAAPGRAGILQAGWLAVHAPKAARRPLDRPVRVVLGAPLPAAGRILAVTARPGQESADLGGVLYAFRRTGVRLALLCLTRGEASPLSSTSQRLEEIRPWELQAAAAVIGISSVIIADFPDGSLSRCSLAALSERVQRAIDEHAPDLLLVIDPATGTPGDAQVAKAVCSAARSAGLPVAARTSTHAPDSWPAGRDRLRWLIRPAASGTIPRPRAPRRSRRGQAA